MINPQYLSMAGTFSKHPKMFGLDDTNYILSTQGSTITMSDTRQYTDWISGLGANLIGNAHPIIIKAVQDEIAKGTAHSLVHQLEYEVAELMVDKIGQRIPGWYPKRTQVRFMKTGSDATSSAVRLARAITGKETVLQCGYSGWHSEFTSATPPAHGIPTGYKRDLIRHIKFNDKSSVIMAASRGDFAAIIIEHPPQDAENGWYEFLRETCNKANALLIIDEVVTGFRWGLGGICESYSIEPDLICYGKALGGGLPLSAVMGPTEYLNWFNRNDPVFVSSTMFGETLSLAAGKAFLEYWDDDKAFQIYTIGEILMDGLESTGWKIVGHSPRSLLVYENDYEKAYFIHGMLDRGHLFNRPNFATLAHTKEDVQNAIDAATDLMTERVQLSNAEVKRITKGRIPVTLFRNR